MITPQQFRNPQVKPKWQAPVGVMESIVAYNCRKYGFPRPVLAMPMWEGAGNRAFDYSGHGNHGSLVGYPDWVSNVLKFDGANDYISIGNMGITPSSFTISILGKRGTVSGGYDVLVGLATPYKISIWLYSDGDIGVGDADGVYDSTGAIWTDVNDFHQLSWVVPTTGSSTQSNLYFDGDLREALPSADTDATWDNATIGMFATPNTSKYNGIIANVLFFDYALSAAQVKFLHENPYFMYQIPEELYGYVAAVGGIAPTSTLYGPLYGPMAGPIGIY